MLKAFDAPSREECTVERPRSNTAPAALVLLNDPTFVEAARSFSGRILQEGGTTTSERIDFAYRQATSRPADNDEKQRLETLLVTSRQYYLKHPKEAHELLSIGLSPRPVVWTLPNSLRGLLSLA